MSRCSLRFSVTNNGVSAFTSLFTTSAPVIAPLLLP